MSAAPNGQVHTPLPGGWHGSELAAEPGLWRVPLPGEVADDPLKVAADPGSAGISADPREPRPEVSASTRDLVAGLYRRLAGRRGMVVLTGFPVRSARAHRGCLPAAWQAARPVDGADAGRQPAGPDGGREGRCARTRRDRAGETDEAFVPHRQVHGPDRAAVRPVRGFRRCEQGGVIACDSQCAARSVPDLLATLYQLAPVHVPVMRVPTATCRLAGARS